MYESKGFLNQEPWLRNCYNSSVLWQPYKISSPLCSFKHELSQSWWYLLKHVSHHYTVRIYLSNIAPLFFAWPFSIFWSRRLETGPPHGSGVTITNTWTSAFHPTGIYLEWSTHSLFPRDVQGWDKKVNKETVLCWQAVGYWSLDGQPGGLNNCHSGSL